MRLVFSLLFFALLFTQAGEAQEATKEINEAWANLKTQFMRRNDLLANITNQLQNSKKIEQETVRRVHKERVGFFKFIDSVKHVDSIIISRAFSINKDLILSISRSLVMLERDQELRNSSPLRELLIFLAGIENRIFVAQNKYNQICTEANRPDLYFGKPAGKP